MTIILATDKVGSVRTTDEDGRLRVAKTNISKATVNGYFGREIPKYQALGLQPDKKYSLLRDPEELKKGIETFNNLPILSDHVHVTAENPRKDLQVGATGSDAAFEEPFLTNSLSIWDKGAIDKINSGEQRELSCAYRYEPVMKAGTYQGQHYDGVMTNIRGNHVALVPKGRAGSDVLVADSEPEGMNRMENINDLIPAVQSLCPDVGGDTIRAALSQLVADLNTKEAEGGENAVAPPAVAEDEGEPELDAFRAALRKDGKSDEEAEKMATLAKSIFCAPEATDEDETEAKANEIAGGEKANKTLDTERKDGTDPSGAEDEDDDGEEEKPKAAMDSMRNSIMRSIRAQQRAREAVKPLVGNLIGMDSASAADIYRYALNQKKISHKGANCAGLRKITLMACDAQQPRTPSQTTAVAMDAAPSQDEKMALQKKFGVK